MFSPKHVVRKGGFKNFLILTSLIAALVGSAYYLSSCHAGSKKSNLTISSATRSVEKTFDKASTSTKDFFGSIGKAEKKHSKKALVKKHKKSKKGKKFLVEKKKKKSKKSKFASKKSKAKKSKKLAKTKKSRKAKHA